MKGIKQIADELRAEYKLNVIFAWDNKDIDEMFTGHPQHELMRTVPFFCSASPVGPSFIKIDLESDPVKAAKAPADHLNILCHELGHLIAGLRAPQDIPDLNLDYVIRFEKAANRIGKKLYARYADPKEYWNNHEDIERMKGHFEKYKGVLNVKSNKPAKEFAYNH